MNYPALRIRLLPPVLLLLTVSATAAREGIDLEAQEQAVVALAAAGDVETLLVVATTHESIRIRREAVFRLGQSGAMDELDAILEDPVQPSDVRRQVLFAYTLLGEVDAVIGLTAAVWHLEQVDLQREAVHWLGQTGTEEAVVVLDEVLASDLDAGVRAKVLDAYTQLPGGAGTSRLERAAREGSDVEIRREAILRVARQGGVGVSKLLDAILDSDGPIEVRKQVLLAYAQLPDGAGLKRLIDAARTNDDPELRREAILRLGESEAPDARAALLEILQP